MIAISKDTWNKLESLKGRLAKYGGRTYRIIDWQITNGEVLLLGIYKQLEYQINYFTPHIEEEQRFFTLKDLI